MYPIPESHQKFNSRQLLAVLNRIGLEHFNEATLKAWHRRGILPQDPVGTGHERTYSSNQVVSIVCLVFVAMFARYGGLHEAVDCANELFALLAAVQAKDIEDLGSSPVFVLEYSERGVLRLRRLSPKTAQWSCREYGTEIGFRMSRIVFPAKMASLLAAVMDSAIRAGRTRNDGHDS
jgi:hypothetical protein